MWTRILVHIRCELTCWHTAYKGSYKIISNTRRDATQLDSPTIIIISLVLVPSSHRTTRVVVDCGMPSSSCAHTPQSNARKLLHDSIQTSCVYIPLRKMYPPLVVLRYILRQHRITLAQHGTQCETAYFSRSLAHYGRFRTWMRRRRRQLRRTRNTQSPKLYKLQLKTDFVGFSVPVRFPFRKLTPLHLRHEIHNDKRACYILHFSFSSSASASSSSSFVAVAEILLCCEFRS